MNGTPARDTHGKIVYVVEDDADVARLIRATLQDFGFGIVACPTAADLFRRIGRQAPDLCIVDLGLPDMDGMDVVRQLRERCDCGILILTGRGYVGDRIMGLELGADDYVAKPFDPRELVARVRSILRRTASPPAGQRKVPGTAQFAGWSFHTGSNTLAAQDGSEWSLSTAEAQLLKTFIAHPNRILSREQLLCERDVSPFDRSIDVRISRLRRKLEADPQNPKLIRTVYGAGYLFAADVSWS
ncbi:response regulator transcription factor [Noviherbaspirillum sp. UKPF54]|uniref:response regulator transcription factor n=1 Tax=Noviherbaspirillum sp. UKPF54 TaxID=2601898 RepID=UPI0011B119C2|nr:response regulator transcription factor [Noviherbaspirillum sp. UKPF54]QDZ29638.1 response regulator transcription factor [Noviherbaspirillum sp. UKPF54]